MSRRWRRVWLTEPAVWREFVLHPMPPPEAALRFDEWECEEFGFPRPGHEEGMDDENERVAAWWEGSTEAQLAAGFAAQRRQLEQTAHLVTHAHLPYGYSAFREQAQRRGGWKLRQLLRALPASLEGLRLNSRMEIEDMARTEAQVHLAATTDALSRFSRLTALQVGTEGGS